MNDLRIEKLREFATEFVAAEPNRLGRAGFWQEPLLVSAPIDARFEILPQIAFNEHLHPHDLLSTARSLIVFFIPFKRELIEENKKGDRPCRNWGLAYVRTNDLIERLSRALEQFLMDTREACLLKAGHKCGQCIQACPVNALKTEGIERRTCWNRLNENRDTLAYLSDLSESTHV
jgi:ferredoxin